MQRASWILPVIVISQFCCTSLWFASNGVMGDLLLNFGLEASALGHLTTAVQLGFIVGTLVFAVLTIADRFRPSQVFFVCALVGALFNLGTIANANTLSSLFVLRFLTGFFLAGIYPVGMKIAADYFDKGLGKSLGYLVGALVIGTAYPHILKGSAFALPWKWVIGITSGQSVLGGLLMLFLVPVGPYRKPGQGLDLSAFFSVFQDRNFRSAAFGYFGHMWELYAFWAFVPLLLETYQSIHPDLSLNVPLFSFVIIGVGGLACVVGGYLSMVLGARKTAFTALALSCLCCLVSPLLFQVNSAVVFIGFLIFWGAVVIADSPLFSTLVAHNAPAVKKGTALTIVNCVGFAITILSIQLLTSLLSTMPVVYMFTLLAIGPVLGLIALNQRNSSSA